MLDNRTLLLNIERGQNHSTIVYKVSSKRGGGGRTKTTKKSNQEGDAPGVTEHSHKFTLSEHFSLRKNKQAKLVEGWEHGACFNFVFLSVAGREKGEAVGQQGKGK